MEPVVVAPLANLEAQLLLCLEVPGGLLLPPVVPTARPGTPLERTGGAFVLNFYVVHLLYAPIRDTKVKVITRRSACTA